MNFKEALIAHLNGAGVECKATDSKWSDFVGCFGHISMDKLRDLTYVGWEFRLTPRTITVNGVEVPAPEKKILRDEVTYFIPSVGNDDLFSEKCNYNPDLTKLHIERGLVYLNKEDAIARAKAMTITKEKV